MKSIGPIALCLALPLAGCASLQPSLIVREEHESHLTQHRPFTDHPTNFGRDILSAGLAVTDGPWRLEVTEGYAVEGDEGYAACPREVFHATVTYEIPLRRKR